MAENQERTVRLDASTYCCVYNNNMKFHNKKDKAVIIHKET